MRTGTRLIFDPIMLDIGSTSGKGIAAWHSYIAMGASVGKRLIGEGFLNRSSSNCSRRFTVWRDKGSCSVGHCQPGWYTRF
jgi:hypothetical protein